MMTKGDIQRAVCNGLDLSRGDFSRQDLSGLFLEGGKFAHCDFRGTDLSSADIQAADFRGANMVGCNLDGALIDRCVRFDDAQGIYDAGEDSREYRFIGVWHPDDEYEPGWKIKAGCRWFTLSDARYHWGPEDQDNEEALELVERIASAEVPK
jgi:hypothetical protein